jgi:capsular polysaccharide biosynthesis protein
MEINFRDFFFLMIRRIPVLLIGVVVGFVSFFSYTKLTEIKKYTCEVTMIVNAAPDTIATSGTIAASQDLAKAYIAILKDYSFAEKIEKRLPEEMIYSAGAIRRSMSMSTVDKSQILAVEVTTSSAQDSYEIAKVIEKIAPSTLRQYFDDTGSIIILCSATKPTSPQPSNLMLNSAMGATVGFIISACIVLLIAKLDKRIRNEDDIRACINYPILGIISRVE